ncbi:hypothetical protein [Mesorhizobium sp. SP-1A]|uniref:hypothetical protein n=1 Tax=Mesorhizobium sp. SP-1A TaxID=3077840 RepID=UPI0028F6FCF0|nr:hypothetical protein [Mesorhizobium sp. SP-1A]
MKAPLDKSTLNAQKHEIAGVMLKHAEGNEKLAVLLTLSVGRVLSNLARKGQNWREAYDRSSVNHIADWLRAAIVNNDPWLANVDAKNRPLKLLKFGDVAQITKEADKAMHKANQKLGGITLVEGDEELFAELEDGFYIVRLMTPAALDKESAEMQHCIGNGGYDRMVEAGVGYYLSLRDQHGKAHATLEVCQSYDYELHDKKMRVEQLQGKQNQPPLQKYAKYLWDFIERNSWEIDIISPEFGVVQDKSRKIYSIYNLPEGFVSMGSVEAPRSGPEINLPANMAVNGFLDLSKAPISVLPPNLRVKDDLKIDETNITELPSCLNVEGDISAENCALKRIHLSKTHMSLLVEGCKDLEFETPIHVGGDLWIGGSGVTSFPTGMKVDGEIYAHQNQIDLNAWPKSLGNPASKLHIDIYDGVGYFPPDSLDDPEHYPGM